MSKTISTETTSTSAMVKPDPETWGVRYWALNATDADPTDENSWTQAIYIVESKIEAYELYDQWNEVYADHPNIRGIQIIEAPPIQWHIVER